MLRPGKLELKQAYDWAVEHFRIGRKLAGDCFRDCQARLILKDSGLPVDRLGFVDFRALLKKVRRRNPDADA